MDMNLSPKTEAGMASYLENDKKKTKAKHVYKDGIHLPREVLEEEFKYYIEAMSKRVKKKKELISLKVIPTVTVEPPPTGWTFCLISSCSSLYASRIGLSGKSTTIIKSVKYGFLVLCET